MKYVVMTVVSGLVVALIAISIMFVSNRSQREAELDNAINSASYEALEEVFINYSTFNSKEEGDKALKELFISKLNERIINGDGKAYDDNLSLDVDFNMVDSKEGLLSSTVCEHYTNIGGVVGSISKEVSVLVDEEASKPQYTLSYIVDGRVYRSFQLNAGDKVIIPALNCSYWEDDKGRRLSSEDIVSEDKVYEAVFV